MADNQRFPSHLFSFFRWNELLSKVRNAQADHVPKSTRIFFSLLRPVHIFFSEKGIGARTSSMTG